MDKKKEKKKDKQTNRPKDKQTKWLYFIKSATMRYCNTSETSQQFLNTRYHDPDNI